MAAPAAPASSTMCQAIARTTTESRLSADRGCDPYPADRCRTPFRRSGDRALARREPHDDPGHRESRARAGHAGCGAAARFMPAPPRFAPEARSASPGRSRRAARRSAPTSSAPRRARVPVAPSATRRASSRAARRAHRRAHPSPRVERGCRSPGSRPRRYPGMSDATTGVAAGERLGKHHAEALAADRRRREHLGRRRPPRLELSVGHDPEDIDPTSSMPESAAAETDRERVGADQAQPGAGLARAISGQARSSTRSPLRCSCRPTNDDVIRADCRGTTASGMRTPFGMISNGPSM